MQNLFKVSKREGFQNGSLSAEIGPEIAERSGTSSNRVCHACARKLRNAFELHNFMYSSLQKVKQAAIEVLKQEKDIKYERKFHCCEVQR